MDALKRLYKESDMALLSALYGIPIEEVNRMSEAQRATLLEHANVALLHQALTNKDLQAATKAQLQPALGAVLHR